MPLTELDISISGSCGTLSMADKLNSIGIIKGSTNSDSISMLAL